ncbi:hypothetical protein P5673_027483, partial [Acropora cervicornis]
MIEPSGSIRQQPILWIGARSMCSCSTCCGSSTNLGIGTAPLLQIPVAVLLIVAEAVPGLITLLSAQAQPLLLPRRQQRIDHLPLVETHVILGEDTWIKQQDARTYTEKQFYHQHFKNTIDLDLPMN